MGTCPACGQRTAIVDGVVATHDLVTDGEHFYDCLGSTADPLEWTPRVNPWDSWHATEPSNRQCMAGCALPAGHDTLCVPEYGTLRVPE